MKFLKGNYLVMRYSSIYIFELLKIFMFSVHVRTYVYTVHELE